MTRRVLVARLDSMGDVLLAGPAIRAIAAAEGTEVWMLCGPLGTDAARLLPGVDQVLEWDCPWIGNPARSATPEVVAELDRLLGTASPDEAVILTSFHQSPLPLALLLRLHGVRQITGASVDYPGSLLDNRLRPAEDLPEDLPEAERALAIAEAAGYPLPRSDDGRLRVTPGLARAQAIPAMPYVVVHPGASVPARQWPGEHFARAVRMLSETGLRVVVTGSPAEQELTAAVAGAAGIDLGGALDLRALAGVLAGASAVIVGNTGPAHLAAAVGTPVVSLFSPVVPAARWAPYGVDVELLGDQAAPCRNSRGRTCPVPGHPCLTGVPPEQAVAACLRLIERASRQGLTRGAEGARAAEPRTAEEVSA